MVVDKLTQDALALLVTTAEHHKAEVSQVEA